ncbi:MAG: nitrous oxide reductase family maturation protein NosD [Anaerolineae bacterium]
MHPTHRFIFTWLFLAAFAAAASGCNTGEVGIPFQDGIECLGEEAQPVAGDTIYVAPDGNDDNAGNRPDAPFATLGRALCHVRPGQTVEIAPGTYRESVIMGLFGDSSAPIVIHGTADAHSRPVLDGESHRTMGIALVESNHIVIEGLEFRNYTDEGLFVLTGSDITIRNNRFVGNGRASTDPEHEGEGFGVNVVGARDVIIEGNEAAENGPAADRVQKGFLGTGINTFELQDGIIRDNHSHHNIGGGLLVEDGTNVLVENNRIDHNELDAGGDYWDGGIWLDGGRDITLRGNVIADNHGPGVEISDEDLQYPEGSRGYLLTGNTITGNLYGIYLWNFGVCPLPEPEIVTLTDNEVTGNTEMDVWCELWPCGEHEACE